MISSTLLCLICTTIVGASFAKSQHLNIYSEKNETDENSITQQKFSGSEIRPDYLNQVNKVKTVVL